MSKGWIASAKLKQNVVKNQKLVLNSKCLIPPPPPPQLDCNPLTERFIYSPLHPHRTDFFEEGIKANKRTKNEKDLISENFLSLDLGKSER